MYFNWRKKEFNSFYLRHVAFDENTLILLFFIVLSYFVKQLFYMLFLEELDSRI